MPSSRSASGPTRCRPAEAVSYPATGRQLHGCGSRAESVQRLFRRVCIRPKGPSVRHARSGHQVHERQGQVHPRRSTPWLACRVLHGTGPAQKTDQQDRRLHGCSRHPSRDPAAVDHHGCNRLLCCLWAMGPLQASDSGSASGSNSIHGLGLGTSLENASCRSFSNASASLAAPAIGPLALLPIMRGVGSTSRTA